MYGSWREEGTVVPLGPEACGALWGSVKTRSMIAAPVALWGPAMLRMGVASMSVKCLARYVRVRVSTLPEAAVLM